MEEHEYLPYVWMSNKSRRAQDVALTSMRRDHVASTSMRSHDDVMSLPGSKTVFACTILRPMCPNTWNVYGITGYSR